MPNVGPDKHFMEPFHGFRRWEFHVFAQNQIYVVKCSDEIEVVKSYKYTFMAIDGYYPADNFHGMITEHIWMQLYYLTTVTKTSLEAFQ